MQDTISLTPRQRRAARYLALGLSQRATSRRMHMSERTIRRWLTDVPGFRGLVDELSELDSIEGVDEAEDVLRDLCYSEDERVRLTAAQSLLRVLPQKAPSDEDAEALAAWT